MDVVYGDKKWSFETELTVAELLKKMGLSREPVLVMADGKIIEKKDIIRKNSKVLIINAANGG
ncbi:MoaD/ThiS family protein [Kosmotoga pacifica]|uniref:Thiamine biosynthesis protein ThiS n=1 Tax=Kosmotoga pacifica TaxID=1330330 RepID=A0A0G2ZBV5_9BACT|nr:MoaD/ThiS family protein [Kosmotoga pacifica]AKI97556.1 hypothetical protein IX53_06705 [Kosmotoga pacifica]